MRILSIEHAVPATVLSNDDMVAMVRSRSAVGHDEEQWRPIEKRLRRYWRATGTQRRHYSLPHEQAIDLVLDAADKALATSGVDRADIDLVVYVGVGRAVLEPAMASLIQQRLGIPRASCFDLLEACSSWLRALQVTRGLLRAGDARNALIVNCEAAFLHLSDFQAHTVDDVDRIVAATTVGEAATATVVTAAGDAADDYYFRFVNLGEYFETCLIPLPSYEGFVGPAANPNFRSNQFYANATELMRVMALEVVNEYRADPRLAEGEYDIVFFHQASERVAEVIRRQIGIPADRCVHIHADYGNTVSATVPLSMSLALDEGRWNRGDRTLVVMGAAGVSIGFATFTF